MKNQIYTININTFLVDDSEYPNRCLSAAFGGSGIQSDIIPWEGTEYNPWDYKYENNEFILDPIDISVNEPTKEEQLEMLRNKMAAILAEYEELIK